MPCPVCKKNIEFQQVSSSSRILNVQLNNLDLICSKCSRIGKLHQLKSHECKLQTTPSTRGKATCFASTDINSTCASKTSTSQQLISNAARVLREEALKHKKGEPIPYEVERATDRWTWLKLQLSNRVAILNTGGRVCTKRF